MPRDPGRIRTPDVFTSTSPLCLDGGHVDFLYRHHRLEGKLCLTAAKRKRIGSLSDVLIAQLKDEIAARYRQPSFPLTR
jgi:hypothetical protein